MSVVELRWVIEGECRCGEVRPAGEPSGCRHRLVSPWGEVEHPEARPDRDQVGHLMMADWRWIVALATDGPVVYPWGGVWSAFTRDGRWYARLDYQPFRLGALLDRMLGREVVPEPVPPRRSWTWEVFPAEIVPRKPHHDDVDEGLLLGRWPD